MPDIKIQFSCLNEISGLFFGYFNNYLSPLFIHFEMWCGWGGFYKGQGKADGVRGENTNAIEMLF